MKRPDSTPDAFANPAPSGPPKPVVQETRSPSNPGPSLADLAMQLRDEQLAARVTHYKAHLETSPELDQVTAQVVTELIQLQQAMRGPSLPPTPHLSGPQLEAELTKSLSEMLARIFRPDKVAGLVERKMGEASKRFAKLFFESELHEKIRGSATEVKAMHFADQALFHVLTRNETYLRRQLDAFDYDDDDVRARAHDQFHRLLRDLRDGFLSKTTPELNAIVKILNEVTLRFFTQAFPTELDRFAADVVRDSRLAESQMRAGYKIPADAFPAFRKAFERRFLNRLVSHAEKALREAMDRLSGKFRVETIQFVSDPHIFSVVCELVCDAVYDYLYTDGFLDLPPDWRAQLL